jgi:hypothetical protein
MKPKELKEAIKLCYAARRPFIIWSPPGCGKSQITYQATNELGIDIEERRTADQDPTDLGFPKIDGNRHMFTTPDFLPTDPQSKGLLFLDEFPQAIPAVKNTWSELILDRRLRDYRLPDGWSIGAAGNRDGDDCATFRLPKHIANRFVHLNLDIDNDQWIEHALTNDFHMDVVFFIKHRPELLYRFDPKADDKAFPSPRSWEFISDLIKQQPQNGIELDIEAGTVGEGAATEFYGFRKIKDKLVSPDLILMNPESADVPTDPAVLFALSASLAQKTTEQSIDRIIRYANRMPKEFSVFLITSAITRTPGLVNTKPYAIWNSRNNNVIT